MVSGKDWCSPEGAARLKQRIEKYWTDRGWQAPEVRLVEAGYHHSVRAIRTDIRSNMSNGWPISNDENDD